MEFRIEDILKNLIPGSLVLTSVILVILGQDFSLNIQTLISQGKDYSEIMLIVVLICCYLFGYILDSLSSFFDYFIIYRILGSPSLKLLQGRGRRIKLVNAADILSHIRSKFPDVSIEIPKDRGKKIEFARVIFRHANILKDGNTSEGIRMKIKEYYFSFVFARNIFYSYTVSILLVIFSNNYSIGFSIWIIMLVIFLILLIRRRDKSYYYSRQVLLASKY